MAALADLRFDRIGASARAAPPRYLGPLRQFLGSLAGLFLPGADALLEDPQQDEADNPADQEEHHRAAAIEVNATAHHGREESKAEKGKEAAEPAF